MTPLNEQVHTQPLDFDRQVTRAVAASAPDDDVYAGFLVELVDDIRGVALQPIRELHADTRSFLVRDARGHFIEFEIEFVVGELVHMIPGARLGLKRCCDRSQKAATITDGNPYVESYINAHRERVVVALVA